MVTKAVARKIADLQYAHGGFSICKCATVSPRCGQNHAINATVTGADPHTTAHGVYIEANSNPNVATALKNGHTEGEGNERR